MPVLVLVWVDVCVCGILQVDVAPLSGGVSIFDLKKCPVYLKRSPLGDMVRLQGPKAI
jgi:hypothetical protein